MSNKKQILTLKENLAKFNSERAEIILELHKQGKSIDEVAQKLGVSTRQVRRLAPWLSWGQKLSSSKKGAK